MASLWRPNSFAYSYLINKFRQIVLKSANYQYGQNVTVGVWHGYSTGWIWNRKGSAWVRYGFVTGTVWVWYRQYCIGMVKHSTSTVWYSMDSIMIRSSTFQVLYDMRRWFQHSTVLVWYRKWYNNRKGSFKIHGIYFKIR